MKICYYHSRDLDGIACGAIFKEAFPDAKLIGYHYREPFTFEPGHDVYMADVSLPMEIMRAIAESSKSFTWFDHHKSAIEEYKAIASEHGDFLTAVLSGNLAGCEILWGALFPDEDMPYTIQMLGSYDVWRKDGRWPWDEILTFQYGMRMVCGLDVDKFHPDLFDERLDNKHCMHILEVGQYILDYQRQQDINTCRLLAFEQEWLGMRAIIMNQGGAGSTTFESVYDAKKHDIMLAFVWAKDHWTVSLRSDKERIDCAEIAKHYGGGGHKGAAGFRTDNINKIITLPF